MSQLTQPVPSTKAQGTEVLLRAKGIRKAFQMGDAEVSIIKGLDFAVRDGEFVAIEGRSGSGKSTLLHILGALDAVNDGTVEFDGVDYTTKQPPRKRMIFIGWVLGDWMRFLVRLTVVLMFVDPLLFLIARVPKLVATRPELADRCFYAFLSLLIVGIVGLISLLVGVIVHENRERPRTRLRNRQFGFVFQFYYLLPELNVVENTEIAARMQHPGLSYWSHRTAIRERAIKILDQLGMSHRLKHRPAHLSGGERQRVAIARALMNEPRVLFADEPTGNLDAETGAQIMGVLEKLHRDRGQTIVMVTHDRTIAGQADRVLVLREGRLQAPSEPV